IVAAGPTFGLTAVLGAGMGNLFMSAPLPFRISIAATIIWVAVAVLGAVLATEAAASRASRPTVRGPLSFLCLRFFSNPVLRIRYTLMRELRACDCRRGQTRSRTARDTPVPG